MHLYATYVALKTKKTMPHNNEIILTENTNQDINVDTEDSKMEELCRTLPIP